MARAEVRSTDPPGSIPPGAEGRFFDGEIRRFCDRNAQLFLATFLIALGIIVMMVSVQQYASTRGALDRGRALCESHRRLDPPTIRYFVRIGVYTQDDARVAMAALPRMCK